MTNPVLDEALRLQEAGYAAILQRGKRAFQPGWNRERQTPEQLREAYKPGLNVAVVTGRLSAIENKALVIVDVDVREPGAKGEAWNALRDIVGSTKPTTLTGGGGAHWWYWIPIEALPTRDKLILAQGPEVEVDGRKKSAWTIEVLLNGHACTVPPSIHPSGEPYTWANGGAAHVAEAPTAIIDAIQTANANATSPSITVVDEWPAPEKLPELPEVPAFNFNVLPGPLRAFVHDIADRMQCPPEFPAVGAVVMAGAAIGRRLGIRPKKFDSWTVVPNVWGMIVGKPGIMKSPALSEAIAPLKRMQAKAFEDYDAALREYEIAERAAKIRAGHAEGEAKKALAKDRGADLKAMLQPDAELIEPKTRRYVVNDSSPEALCETLKDNPHGVLCERDELIGLLRSMDKEGNQEARALYLTAADGDKSFTVDRIMRGSGRHIEGLCVSIVGGIQPGVLAGYVRETQKGGAGDDGLLQRFGMPVYPDISPTWKNVDRLPDLQAKDALNALIERLCNLTPEAAGAELDPYSPIPFIRFDDKAQELFIEWREDLETKLRGGDDHPAITSHLAKYRKLAPALALINHVCEGGTGPVSEQALGRALLFVELLEAHARRVYSYAARPDLDAAKTVLAKLRAGKLPIEFKARDVYRPGWSGLTTAEEAGAALRLLEDYGHLRERRNDDTGGRSSTIYRAHPSTKAAA